VKARALIGCFVVALGLGVPVAAADDTPASLVRQISQYRWETNTARPEAGLKPFKTNQAYRDVQNIAALQGIQARWLSRARAARKLTPQPTSVWVKLANCESGGDWKFNGPGIYDGGLQFHPRTWKEYKLRGYPKVAWKATPMQQILVGYKVLADQGWDAWPACAKKLKLRSG